LAEHRQTSNNVINPEPDQMPQEATTDKVAIAEVCETKCTEKQGVEEHTTVHPEETSTKSPNCDLITGKLVKQDDLMTTHIGEKSPAFTECNNTLNGENHINEHTTVHTGEKPLQCTKSENDSQAQLATHTRETDNTCIECNINFTTKNGLKTPQTKINKQH
ncbi:unnamed protein product, partial [Meganyctiphanes norvegica]